MIIITILLALNRVQTIHVDLSELVKYHPRGLVMQPLAILLYGFFWGSSRNHYYYLLLVLVMRPLATSISMYVSVPTEIQ